MVGRKKELEEIRRKRQWPNLMHLPRLLRKNKNTGGRMTSLEAE
jgi:hypothetical protein